MSLVAIQFIGDDKTAGQVRRRLDRVSQAAGQIRLHDEPVDHDLDVVLLVLVERISSVSSYRLPSTRTRA